MTIFRIPTKTNPFVILDKTFINDSRLSMKAKGLLVVLLSLPSDYRIHIKKLAALFTDGKHSVGTALKEIRSLGYVVRRQARGNSGTFNTVEYDVFEIPQCSEHSNNDNTDFDESAPLLEPQNKTNMTSTPQSENQVVDHLVIKAPQPENQDADSFLTKIPQPENQFVDPFLPKTPQPKNQFLDEFSHSPQPKNQFLDEFSHSPQPDFPLAENQPLINNKYNINNKTAAEEVNPETRKAMPSSDAAAAFLPEDALIGENLTPGQQQHIRALATHFASRYALSTSTLEEQLITTMLNPKNFSHAGRDFLKKLNTLRKCLHEGRWTSPASLVAETQANQEKKQELCQQELQLHQGEKMHWQRLLRVAQQQGKQGAIATYTQLLTETEAKITSLEQTQPNAGSMTTPAKSARTIPSNITPLFSAPAGKSAGNKKSYSH